MESDDKVKKELGELVAGIREEYGERGVRIVESVIKDPHGIKALEYERKTGTSYMESCRKYRIY